MSATAVSCSSCLAVARSLACCWPCGRAWRVPRPLEERLRVPEYRALVRLFADHPGEESLFSIHNMCQVREENMNPLGVVSGGLSGTSVRPFPAAFCGDSGVAVYGELPSSPRGGIQPLPSPLSPINSG